MGVDLHYRVSCDIKGCKSKVKFLPEPDVEPRNHLTSILNWGIVERGTYPFISLSFYCPKHKNQRGIYVNNP